MKGKFKSNLKFKSKMEQISKKNCRKMRYKNQLQLEKIISIKSRKNML